MGSDNSKLEQAQHQLINERNRREQESRDARDREDYLRRQRDSEAAAASESYNRQIRERMENERRQMEKEAEQAQNHARELKSVYDQKLQIQKDSQAAMEKLNEETRTREERTRKENEEMRAREKAEHDARYEKLNATSNKIREDKNKEILATIEKAHEEKMEAFEEKEREKEMQRKEHEKIVTEVVLKHEHEKKLNDEQFEIKIAKEREEANLREENLKREKAEAQREFNEKEKANAKATEEKRTAMRKEHATKMERKDAEISSNRRLASEREDELREENRKREEEHRARINDLMEQNVQQVKEMGEIKVRAALELKQQSEVHFNDKLKMQQHNFSQQFMLLSQMNHQTQLTNKADIDIHLALASEADTKKLQEIRAKVEDGSKDTDEDLFNVHLSLEEYAKLSSSENKQAVEKAIEKLIESSRALDRDFSNFIGQIDRRTSVKMNTRSQWKALVREIYDLTSPFEKRCRQLRPLAKRNELTKEILDEMQMKFDEIRRLIYDLPIMRETSVTEVMMNAQAERLAVLNHHAAMRSMNGAPSYPSIAEPTGEE